MSKGARAGKRMAGRRISAAIAAASVMVLAAACGGSSGGSSGASGDKAGVTTIEFSQWWEPELPKGSLRGLMDKFEAANPKIKVKLLSAPYASTKEQLVSGAASGTMADVVGLDGAWVNDFAKQGAITDLSTLMSDAKYDPSQLASQVKVDGKTYMIPVVNFVYPLFVEQGPAAKAGVDGSAEHPHGVPGRGEEDQRARRERQGLGAAARRCETPNGVQNDVMSWLWASGGSHAHRTASRT